MSYYYLPVLLLLLLLAELSTEILESTTFFVASPTISALYNYYFDYFNTATTAITITVATTITATTIATTIHVYTAHMYMNTNIHTYNNMP